VIGYRVGTEKGFYFQVDVFLLWHFNGLLSHIILTKSKYILEYQIWVGKIGYGKKDGRGGLIKRQNRKIKT
jgi:hypothetical protein